MLRIFLLIKILIITTVIKAKDKPNIILIYADDLGYSDLACYGNRYFETPNIDKLADKGILFEQCYSDAPLCAPARVSMLTGQSSTKAGCYEVINGRFLNQVNIDSVNFIPPFSKLSLPKGKKIIPEYLKTLGYNTGFFGKWHVGNENPNARGFNDYVILKNSSHWDVTKSFVGSSSDFPKPAGYSSDYLTACTKRFLDKNKEAGGKPFFVYLAYTLVHTCLGKDEPPLQPKPELLRKYQDKKKSKLHFNPAYAAMVEALDKSVGDVIAELEQRGLLENTIIIFTSDNGGLLGDIEKTYKDIQVGTYTSNYPLRGGKAQLLEGGTRVPMIVSYPKSFLTGVKSKAVVSHLDLMPTILELATYKQSEKLEGDGTSLVNLFENKGAELPARDLFWHYPGYRFRNLGEEGREAPGPQRPQSAILSGQWKMFESLEDGAVELYNIKNDIKELKNVAGKNPEIASALQKKLEDWRKSTNAPMPTPKQKN